LNSAIFASGFSSWKTESGCASNGGSARVFSLPVCSSTSGLPSSSEDLAADLVADHAAEREAHPERDDEAEERQEVDPVDQAGAVRELAARVREVAGREPRIDADLDDGTTPNGFASGQSSSATTRFSHSTVEAAGSTAESLGPWYL
jgi:hypothetical protein